VCGGAAGSAVAQIIEWFGEVRNQSVGPLFLVNVVAGVMIAALLIPGCTGCRRS
jgi:hypothetical protein